jgi:hypothetical protein
MLYTNYTMEAIKNKPQRTIMKFYIIIKAW